MDPFQYLPYDKLYELCESLDDKSLSQLIQTSTKAYDLCQGILIQRRQRYEKRVETGFGPIVGYIDQNEFYILNFFGREVCNYCQSRNLVMITRQPRSSDEGMESIKKCIDCGEGWSYDYEFPGIRCSSFTKKELLILADRIGYKPESYDLTSYSNEELCRLLRNFFERHGKIKPKPLS